MKNSNNLKLSHDFDDIECIPWYAIIIAMNYAQYFVRRKYP